jgi:hypothetical protein
MTEFPDVYAEVFSITAGPFGCILTFSHILPTGETVAHQDPTEIVARVRMSPAAAKALVEGLNSTLAAAERGVHETKTISH